MASTPPAPDDLRELRRQAAELRRAVSAGEAEALTRVLLSHPKYAGRPVERLQPRAITLRDAQETVASEHGFDGWVTARDHLHAQPAESMRWDQEAQSRLDARFVMFARGVGARHAHLEHVLDAVASPPKPTIAARVLAGLGYEPRDSGPGRPAGETSSTPAQQALNAFAAGLALGMSASTVTDEHLLLAFAYTDSGVRYLCDRNLDPDDIVAGLAAAGVAVPGVAPRIPELPVGPLGPRVYFRGPGSGLAPELHRRYPPGTVHIGFNHSVWKPGWGYVDAEDEVPLEQIVRSIIENPADIEVVPVWEAARAERRSATSAR